MKKFARAILLLLIFAAAVTVGRAYGEDSQPIQNPIQVDLGEGNGAVIIIGDYNTVYLPPVEEEPACESSYAAVQTGGVLLVVNNLTLDDGGVKTQFRRVVLWFADDGSVSVVSAQQ